jgi:leucyl/phenylalanyl-tRNA--protein transferase
MLSTETSAGVVGQLLDAYRRGWFPMSVPRAGGRRRIEWFNPVRRGILPLEGLVVARTLRQRVRSGRFRVTSDEAFGRVIRACAEVAEAGERAETWIDGQIVEAYEALQAAGHAHSVEAWLDGKGGPRLVGGLYGVHIGGLFAGESMFSRPEDGGTDASKVCLVHLVGHLRRRGFILLDTQFGTPHLARMGGIEVSKGQYLAILGRAVEARAEWGRFEALRSDGDV